MIEEFLKELTELTKKYKIVIHGCGCHGSPFLSETQDIEGKYSVDDEWEELTFSRGD